MNDAATPSPRAAPTGAPVAASRADLRLVGSDGAEKTVVRVGFMPLTDCASLVMASVLGLDEKHGVKLKLSRQSSWAGLRDRLLGGALDMAQVLYGLVYGVHLGAGGLQHDMAVLMTLNRNGQGLSLSRRLVERGATDLASLAARIRQEPGQPVFAQTFPTGTHAMWLYYWLASVGIHPMRDAASIVVPPPQMVTAVRNGWMDGFSVGEPWNQLGIDEGVSVHAAASQDVWPDHPEKVLGCTAAFADTHPHTCRAVIRAVLEAGRWIDASDDNRRRCAAVMAGEAYIGVPVSSIAGRLGGQYEDGMGRRWQHPHPMRFFDGGAVNFPYLSDGMWFMTQHKRWGLLAEHPDYLPVARRVQRIALYREAAAQLCVAVPPDAMRRSRLIDGVVWDGQDPGAYADAFALQMPPRAALQAA